MKKKIENLAILVRFEFFKDFKPLSTFALGEKLTDFYSFKIPEKIVWTLQNFAFSQKLT